MRLFLALLITTIAASFCDLVLFNTDSQNTAHRRTVNYCSFSLENGVIELSISDGKLRICAKGMRAYILKEEWQELEGELPEHSQLLLTADPYHKDGPFAVCHVKGKLQVQVESAENCGHLSVGNPPKQDEKMQDEVGEVADESEEAQDVELEEKSEEARIATIMIAFGAFLLAALISKSQ